MLGEFPLYKEAPGFWLFAELLVASDVSNDPELSAKYEHKYAQYEYSLYDAFEEGVKRFKEGERWRKERLLW